MPIAKPLETGISVIDGLLPLGYGQRIGLFAGAGTGKSTLLGSMARNADVDLTVIALIGERGREVREFVETALGTEGLKRAIVVVSTSDESPIRRRLAALSATAYAEYYRSKGAKVLLLMDSLTRLARAVREISLSAGEPPIQRGYTPSVYTELPQLLERAGNDDHGSITAIYTVLTTDDQDPLGEEIKSLLDGHIVLHPSMLEHGIRPAIDTTISVSRLTSALLDKTEQQVVSQISQILHRLKKDRDLLLFGGTPDPQLKAAVELWPEIRALLNQKPEEKRVRLDTLRSMAALVLKYQQMLPGNQQPAAPRQKRRV